METEMADDAVARTWIIVPTYNERDNVAAFVSAVLEVVPDGQVLIVDDNSPDGTGMLADELAEADHRVSVLHREEKAGLGAAYRAGFVEALRHYFLGVPFTELRASAREYGSELARLVPELRRRAPEALSRGASCSCRTTTSPGDSRHGAERRSPPSISLRAMPKGTGSRSR